MKTKEELNALKEEVETLNKKLAELTDEEIAQVAGGGQNYWLPIKDGGKPIVLPNNDSGKPIVPPNNDNDGNSWGPSWGGNEK